MRGEQRTVPAETRGIAQDRSDVGVVDDVFHDHQPAPGQQLIKVMTLLAVQ